MHSDNAIRSLSGLRGVLTAHVRKLDPCTDGHHGFLELVTNQSPHGSRSCQIRLKAPLSSSNRLPGAGRAVEQIDHGSRC